MSLTNGVGKGAKAFDLGGEGVAGVQELASQLYMCRNRSAGFRA
jgi:hypothetical protein